VGEGEEEKEMMKRSNPYLEEMKTFSEQYELVAHKNISQLKEKSYAFDKVQRCRFCNRKNDGTNFKNSSHMFPQFIGNKYAISTYECDECNERFSRNVENDFANLMKLFHTVNSIKGANKIPTYKKNGIRVSTENGQDFKISGVEDDSVTENGLNCKLETDSFVPMRIYKMLTKMALSIVDEKELDYFSATIEWLNDEADCSFNVESFPLLITQNKNNADRFDLSVSLAKKKIDCQKKPTFIFKLFYGLFSFQIYLPLCKLDKSDLMPNIETFQFISNRYEMEANSKASYRLIMECNENKKGHIFINLNIINLENKTVAKNNSLNK